MIELGITLVILATIGIAGGYVTWHAYNEAVRFNPAVPAVALCVTIGAMVAVVLKEVL